MKRQIVEKPCIPLEGDVDDYYDDHCDHDHEDHVEDDDRLLSSTGSTLLKHDDGD